MCCISAQFCLIAIVYRYIVGVQRALKGLENRQMEKNHVLPLSYGVLVSLVLKHSDVAGMTLTSHPHGADPHEGQFTQSGREHGEPRLDNNCPSHRIKPPQHFSTSVPSFIFFSALQSDVQQRPLWAFLLSTLIKTTTRSLVLQWINKL